MAFGSPSKLAIHVDLMTGITTIDWRKRVGHLAILHGKWNMCEGIAVITNSGLMDMCPARFTKVNKMSEVA